jgi:hypothetical protein
MSLSDCWCALNLEFTRTGRGRLQRLQVISGGLGRGAVWRQQPSHLRRAVGRLALKRLANLADAIVEECDTAPATRWEMIKRNWTDKYPAG